MIRDDFAGPGGWDEGMAALGINDVVGVELDRWACETALAAGHRRIRGDVTRQPSEPWAGLDGYVASPPCTSFSAAGKGEGAGVLPAIITAARMVADGFDVPTDVGGDHTTALILEPVRVVRDLRPRWVALEQVPPCLPVWQEYARLFRSWGYSASCAVLNSANYGVPQTRRRAILVARLDGPALLPEPTHAEHPGDGLFGSTLPWVSMAAALGWDGSMAHQWGAGMAERHGDRPPFPSTGPAPTMTTGSHRRMVVDRRTNSRGPKGTTVPTVGVGTDRPAPSFTGKSGTQWVLRPGGVENPTVRTLDEPAPTVAFGHDAGSWAWERPATTIVGSFAPDVVAAPGYRQAGDGPRQNTPGSIRIQPWEAAVLQSFRPDYPWAGPKTAVFGQIGNCVPPVLGAAVVGALLGLDWRAVLEGREAA